MFQKIVQKGEVFSSKGLFWRFSFIIFSNVGGNVIAPKILQLNQRDGV